MNNNCKDCANRGGAPGYALYAYACSHCFKVTEERVKLLDEFIQSASEQIREINQDKRIPPLGKVANILVNAPLALEQVGHENKRAVLLRALRALGVDTKELDPDYMGTRAVES